MKQSVIRVLWPQQPGLPVQQWQCVHETAGFPEGMPQHDAQPAALTLQDAVLACARAETEGQGGFSIVLPAEMALYDRVQLPARSQRQALQALPFVVEEQLADDIEDVHLAVGERQSDGSWPVLAVNREQVQELYDWLVLNAATPETVSIDAEMLPCAAGELRLVLHEDRILVRSGTLVTSLERVNAPLLQQMLEGNERFSRILIHYEDGHEQQRLLADQWAAEFAALDDVTTVVQPLPRHLSALLFSDPNARPINLLQGGFTLRKPSVGIPWWQVAAAVLFIAVSAQTLLQLTSGWYFSRRGDGMMAAAEQQYRDLFPEAKKVSNPRKRLESRLAGGDGQAGRDGFASLFGSTVDSLRTVGNGTMAIEQLRYEGKRGELELELKVKSIQQLDQLKQSLAKSGLQADIASANESAEGVIGRIKVRAGS